MKSLKTKDSIKPQRGGTRKGAGPKFKYDEKTGTISFRCPVSKIIELKQIINDKLEEYKK